MAVVTSSGSGWVRRDGFRRRPKFHMWLQSSGVALGTCRVPLGAVNGVADMIEILSMA
jgi:hypothetical protein